MLHEEYSQNGLTKQQIAHKYNCSLSTVTKFLKKFEIPLKEVDKFKGSSRSKAYGKRVIKGEIVDHLAEQRVIRSILEMVDKGLSYRQICKVLDGLKVPTRHQGQGWKHESIYRIVKVHNRDKK